MKPSHATVGSPVIPTTTTPLPAQSPAVAPEGDGKPVFGLPTPTEAAKPQKAKARGLGSLSTGLQAMANIETIMTHTPKAEHLKVYQWFIAEYGPKTMQLHPALTE